MLVPKVEQANDERWRICSDIETTLEHLVIVPRETEYGYNPFSYRTDEARLKWQRYPWPTLHGFARAKAALLSWLALNNVRDDHLIAYAHLCLSKEPIYAENVGLNERVCQLIANKPLQLSWVVRALGIPTEQVELLYLDVATREARREALPLLA